MANIVAREKAQNLRISGWSINDIAKYLDTSQSTVSYWCRDVLLTTQQIKKLQEKSKLAGSRKFIELGVLKRKQRLEKEYVEFENGKSLTSRMSKQNLFFLGLGLYWGEGYKHGNGELGFTNTDGKMILVFIRWLDFIYGVKKNDLILRVGINQIHQDRIDIVHNYWAQLTGIPQDQFTKATFIKTSSKKRYANHDNYFGILRVKVRRGSLLKQRILGSLEGIL
ncbi:MAG TPA: helix-turn-helix domain-containing protein [Candidatus Paceibacterota bacterium]